MNFYTWMTRVLQDATETWDLAGAEAVTLCASDEKELDDAFEAIQFKANREEEIHSISAFRLVSLEE